MKTVLVIQSRLRPELIAGEQEEYRRVLLGTDVTPIFKSSLDESLPWTDPVTLLDGVSAVILGGSGDLDFDGGRAKGDPVPAISSAIVKRLTPFVDFLFAHDVPTLGICFGHQIIAEVRGTKVVNDPLQKKVGTYPVTLTQEGKENPLFAPMPETFEAQYGHKDSLSGLPEGATALATGSSCRYAALSYGGRLYSVQFHPELRAEDVANKLRLSPGYLPEGIDADEITRPSPEASTLIPRFIELALK